MSVNVTELRARVQELSKELEELERQSYRTGSVLNRGLSLTRKMGLPDRADDQIATMQKMIRTAQSLQAAYLALQAARLSAGDPFAWVSFGLTVGSLAIDIGSDVF